VAALSTAVTEETSGRARQLPVFHCPYCGDEELTPYGDTADGWLCHACLRAFTVRLIETGVQSG
jgi:transposase-like protein